MPSLLDFRRLRYFRAIAEHGSFAAAGRALHVAQPALSHHMAELERLLGVKLLERSHRGTRPTDAGAALLLHARTILDAVVGAERSMDGFRANGCRLATTTIRIAIIPSLATGLTPLLFSSVSRDLPGIALHIVEAATRQSHAMLEAGEIDLAINLVTARRPNVHPLIREELVLVSLPAPGGPDPSSISFRDLARRRLVLQSPGKPIRRLLDEIAESQGLSLNVVIEIDGLGPCIRAVLEDLGCTVMAPFNVADECAAGLLEVHPIVSPPISRQIVLERREGFDPSVAERLRGLLIELLRTLLGSHGHSDDHFPAKAAAAW
jgi:LysR family nitrogen assimilation transcriptional regulator